MSLNQTIEVCMDFDLTEKLGLSLARKAAFMALKDTHCTHIQHVGTSICDVLIFLTFYRPLSHSNRGRQCREIFKSLRNVF